MEERSIIALGIHHVRTLAKALAYHVLVFFYVLVRTRLYLYLLFCGSFATIVTLLPSIRVNFHPRPPRIDAPDDPYGDTYPPFEPPLYRDLGDSEESKIERIIHLTWKGERIPPKFVSNIKSFVNLNADWKYFFWSDTALRRLVERRYPELLPLFQSYIDRGTRERMIDAARYVILYLYGGVFVDMDTICHRPLDSVVVKHHCILPPVPYEQSIFTYQTIILTTSIMLCRAKHPFFKQMLDNLHTSAHLVESWDSTGPGYLTSQYRMYTAMYQRRHTGNKTLMTVDNRPFMAPEDYSRSDPDAVYVPNSNYFMVNGDTGKHREIVNMCRQFDKLPLAAQRLCADLKRRGLKRDRHPLTYTEHLWQNSWFDWKNFYIYTDMYLYFYGKELEKISPHMYFPFSTINSVIGSEFNY